MYLILQSLESYPDVNFSFSNNFLQTLSGPYVEQKKIKNQILQDYFDVSEKELIFLNQQHQRKSDFFSASYSGDWLFLGIANSKIGIDLEEIKPRSETLFQKYKEELGKLKLISWPGFYLLWTAKESILKASDSVLDDLDKILFLEAYKKEGKIGSLLFSWELKFSFGGRAWTVQSHENGKIVYSLCIK